MKNVHTSKGGGGEKGFGYNFLGSSFALFVFLLFFSFFPFLVYFLILLYREEKRRQIFFKKKKKRIKEFTKQ